MHPAIRISLAVAVLLCGAVLARAQVASPTLIPARPELGAPQADLDAAFVPSNPAVMQWDPFSQLGVGVARATLTDTATPGSPETDFDGSFTGLRWVGEWLSAGLEANRIVGKPSAGDQKISGWQAALAGRPADALAVGVARNRQTYELASVPAGTLDVESKATVDRVGVSVRLGHLFYIGYARGSQDIAFDESISGTHVTFSRNAQAYGVALRRDGGVAWRLEWNRIRLDKGGDPTAYEARAERISEGVFEVRIGSVAVGLAAKQWQRDSSATEPGETVDSRILDLAWVPNGGLAYTLHLERSGIDEDAPSTQSYDGETMALSIAYLF